MNIVIVCGARPNFIKIAPIAHAIRGSRKLKHKIIHTGQHYDQKMSKSFFKALNIPKPDVNLEIGSSSHATQTARIMQAFEKVLPEMKADYILVVGDVNSTMACALVAKKLNIRVGHVEAGLRSFDRQMPEEINRIVTDAISDDYFITEPSAKKNLLREGISANRIHFTGNVMIDSLKNNLQSIKGSSILKHLQLKPKKYATITMHRPANVDLKESFLEFLNAFEEISEKVTLIFPAHPRTLTMIKKHRLLNRCRRLKSFHLVDPLNYHDMLNLVMNSKFIITDSGGLQEESTYLKVPCLTIRDNTERPITISTGSNTLVGTKTKKLVQASLKILNGRYKKGKTPQFWDGKSSQRILKVLESLRY